MIQGLDHVQLAIPIGGEDKARAFYQGVLGLTEVPKPSDWPRAVAAGSRIVP